MLKFSGPRFSGRSYSVLFGVSLFALTLPTAVQAQRGGGSGGVIFEIYEEPVEEEPVDANPGAQKPFEVVKPAVRVYDPPLNIYSIVEAIPRPPPPPPKYTSHSIYPFEDSLLDKVTVRALETFSGDREFARYIERLEEIKDDSDAEWAALNLKQGAPILIATSTPQ
jgi:hypothetical protein